MRSEVYKNIRDRLLEQLPMLQFVDLQKGQFVQPAQNYPIPLPAALVNITPTSWSNMEAGHQMGETTVSVSLYYDLVTDSFDGAEQEAETIAILDMQDAVFQALEGLAGEDFNPLNRTSEQPAQYGTRYVCYTTNFKTTIYSIKN